MNSDLAFMTELEKHFDNVYVRQQKCNEIQKQENEKISRIDKRLEIEVHDIALIKKIMWLIFSSVLGLLVTSVLSIILK